MVDEVVVGPTVLVIATAVLVVVVVELDVEVVVAVVVAGVGVCEPVIRPGDGGHFLARPGGTGRPMNWGWHSIAEGVAFVIGTITSAELAASPRAEERRAARRVIYRSPVHI